MKKTDYNMKNFVITIGRQLGSGGKVVAEGLARELGVKVYDKTLLQAAARESGIDAEVFERADERSSGSFFGNLFSIHGSMSEYMPGDSYLDSNKLFEIQSDAIRNIAQNESCIIVGRCAEYVLRDHPATLSVFITADHGDRISRIMGLENLGYEAAAEFIEKGDKKRRSYHDYYATTRWGEAGCYDICVNSSRLGIDGTVAFLKQFITTHFGL